MRTTAETGASGARPTRTGGTRNISCSWADDKNVKSVFNNGTGSRFTGVAYCLDKDCRNRVGCTKQGKVGNLAGSYEVRSHRWVDGACGSRAKGQAQCMLGERGYSVGAPRSPR